jgi:hypothetical protein
MARSSAPRAAAASSRSNQLERHDRDRLLEDQLLEVGQASGVPDCDEPSVRTFVPAESHRKCKRAA